MKVQIHGRIERIFYKKKNGSTKANEERTPNGVSVISRPSLVGWQKWLVTSATCTTVKVNIFCYPYNFNRIQWKIMQRKLVASSAMQQLIAPPSFARPVIFFFFLSSLFFSSFKCIARRSCCCCLPACLQWNARNYISIAVAYKICGNEMRPICDASFACVCCVLCAQGKATLLHSPKAVILI